MFTPTLRCECAQPASDRLMRKWCITSTISYLYASFGQYINSVVFNTMLISVARHYDDPG